MKRRRFLKTSLGAVGAAMFGLTADRAIAGTGFHMPDEAEPHERTFMQWPVNRRVHPDPSFLDLLQQAVADVANTIAEFEPVVMLMDQKYEARARRKLGRRVEVWPVPTDDLWCRDAGPIFVKNERRELAVAHIQFNGWGNKQVHDNDGKVAERVAGHLGLRLLETGLFGEGGGVETDGHGTLIGHESSWLNPNRNRINRQTIEERLLEALGADKMIWAPGLKNADITDFHIDALARFVRPGRVVIQLPAKPNPRDRWSAASFKTYEILRAEVDAKGRRLELTILPEPYNTRITSRDFLASYVNYYVCNGAVISAQFGDRKTDAKVKAALAKLHPDREIIVLNIDPIGEVGGGIHCATQQQPKA